MASIYLTTNLINGKKYIGADSRDLPSYLGSGIIIKQAIKKYGKENFKKIILEVCGESMLYDREIYWINHYNAVNSPVFYNISNGGKGGNRLTNEKTINKWKKNTPNLAEISRKRKGKTYEEIYGDNSQIEKEKRRNTLLGIKKSEDVCKKISESLKGNKPWNKGLTKKTDKRILLSTKKSKSHLPFKEYTLITQNNEKLTFIGKKQLEEYIMKINKILSLKQRINVDKLIQVGEDKGYKVSYRTNKRTKI